MGVDLKNTYQKKETLTDDRATPVKYIGDRSLVVNGIAGAGKSAVIQALARKILAECEKGICKNIAIFTVSNTMNTSIRESLGIYGEREKFATVTTLSSYLTYAYNAIGAPKLNVTKDSQYWKLKKEAVSEAIDEHKKANGRNRLHNLDLKFWLDEFDWMKDMNISPQDLECYLSIPRNDREGKVRMSAADRMAAFQIFTNYDRAMKKRKVDEWADQPLYLVRNAKRIPDSLKFDYILVDDAQDMSLAQVAATMMLFRKGMTVALDVNQRIFEKHWSTKQLGIGVTKLTSYMPTTRQIEQLAESIRQKNDSAPEDEDRTARPVLKREGPVPTLTRLNDAAAEKKYVTKLISHYLKQNSKASIGIIASQNDQVETYSSWMTDAGIYSEIIDTKSTFSMAKPGVKIVNVYDSKGLEFTRVIIPQFVEGNFPYSYKSTDQEQMRKFLAKSRNLVYVAMTRSNYSLDLTYCGEKGSRFIGEMDPKCFEAKGEPLVYFSPARTGITRTVKQKEIELPPTALVEPKAPEARSLKEFFTSKGLEVIDKRTNGGNFWVVGDKKKLEPHVKEAGKLFGAFGNYSVKGGRATGHRPGWFTSCKK